jgi:hypothetical protein
VPDAELYGADKGFPVPGFIQAVLQGNPYKPEYRVGAFSHFDTIYATRRIKRAAVPWIFKRSPTDIRYSYRGRPSSLTEYLARNSVTGLLIAKDDQILSGADSRAWCATAVTPAAAPMAMPPCRASPAS